MSPEEAVLSRVDYEDYDRARPLFADCLTVDLLDKTFLFLGVGFMDPNLNLLLARLRSISGAGPKQHYWVVRSSRDDECLPHWDKLRADDLRRYGIQALTVSDYDQVPEFLSEVAQRCDRERRARTVFISGSVEEGAPNAVLVRETAEQLVTMLCNAGLRIATGLGAGLGDYTVAAAFDHLTQAGRPPRLEQLTAYTYPLRARLATSEEERAGLVTKSRRKVIGSAAFVVFLCGRQRERERSGVWKEYCIAKELGCYLIPVGATGGISSEIWVDLRKELGSRFGALLPQVEDNFMALNGKETRPDQLAETVLALIQRLRDLG